MFAVRVECYAGYRGEETPRRFFLGRRRVEVAEVIDRWRTPNHRCFKLRDAEGIVYILRQDIACGAWEMTLYQRRTEAAKPLPPS